MDNQPPQAKPSLLRPQLEGVADQLVAVLRDMVRGHEQLLTLLGEKRDALRGGDIAAMLRLSAVEREQVAELMELERQRREAVARGLQLLDHENPSGGEGSLRDMAAQMPEPMRGRLLWLREQLRERMARVQAESSVARRAADTLLRHVRGLVRVVSAAPHNPTYGRRGGDPPTPDRLRTINTTA